MSDYKLYSEYYICQNPIFTTSFIYCNGFKINGISKFSIILMECNVIKVRVGVLNLVQQPGSYWDRPSAFRLVRLEHTEVPNYD